MWTCDEQIAHSHSHTSLYFTNGWPFVFLILRVLCSSINRVSISLCVCVPVAFRCIPSLPNLLIISCVPLIIEASTKIVRDMYATIWLTNAIQFARTNQSKQILTHYHDRNPLLLLLLLRAINSSKFVFYFWFIFFPQIDHGLVLSFHR